MAGGDNATLVMIEETTTKEKEEKKSRVPGRMTVIKWKRDVVAVTGQDWRGSGATCTSKR